MDQAETEEYLRKAFTSDPPPTGNQLVTGSGMCKMLTMLNAKMRDNAEWRGVAKSA